jgi:hypothetical protein
LEAKAYKEPTFKIFYKENRASNGKIKKKNSEPSATIIMYRNSNRL